LTRYLLSRRWRKDYDGKLHENLGRMKPLKPKAGLQRKPAATLKSVAELVGVTASTVSAVLNNSSAARSVPDHTKKRILKAARALDYRPNFSRVRCAPIVRTWLE